MERQSQVSPEEDKTQDQTPEDPAQRDVQEPAGPTVAPERKGSETAVQDEHGKRELPDELPVLAVAGNVVFPGMIMPEHLQQEGRLRAFEEVLLGDKLFLALLFRGEPTDPAAPDDVYPFGTTCIVLQMLRMPDGSVRFLAQGLQRSRVHGFSVSEKGLRAKVTHPSDEEAEDDETEALTKNLRNQFIKLVDMQPNATEEIKVVASNLDAPGRIADLVCANIGISVQEKQEILETLNVKQRVQRATALMAREMEFVELAHRIQSQARSEIDKGQREYYLRQQLKAIQEELGEGDAQAAEINELRQRLAAKPLSDEVRKEAERQLDRLERINPASPEHTVARTYLDWVLDLPWLESTPDSLDLQAAQRVLEEDHHGLDKIKERVLEFLAVCKLREDMTGSILCFVGPPGTGKTSIGKSIARAMGRKYVRLSLGGVRDEAEIRGHRRTYIGALPGRIILGLKKAGSNNPVFMLDEVDKLGADFRGDPSSALLEVLDPEQNYSFSDHYLDLPFDLSKVLFICTANMLDTLPPALRDRMEVLEFPGYTREEKLQIAKRYLVPQQVQRHGLSPEQVTFTDAALSRLITEYTREAGVRNLERQIGSVCRKVAKGIALGQKAVEAVDAEQVPELLGPPQFLPQVAERVTEPGVATGLAWTPTGGTLMFVETTRTPGEGRLILTGQMGDVMKESAQAALTYTRAHTQDLGIAPELLAKSDFHIHVPAGSVPKDGPSAGVTMSTALVSLLTGRPVRHNVAMTGEITLRGKVLPVGGIKEKVLAAYAAPEIDTVVLPKQNEKDIVDVPASAREKLRFIFADKVDEIAPVALAPAPKKRARKKVSRKGASTRKR